uniref:Reverse transcriptase domain-containing protein n=1 Tax=Tanacetum cinerariifolium TaxID=118510 RepID=A0A699H7A8_TANCI|nr:hypothetical protein [Tanacetum cinerariifolium]
MEQYISKTRADYGSGVARPEVKDKDNFELKGQFLKELCTNTLSGLNHEDVNEHIEKVLEIVDLFHIPNINTDQVMLTEVVLFYNGFPTRQILDSRGAIPLKTAADAKVAIQEMAEYSQKLKNGTYRTRSIETSNGLSAIQAQLNNLGREIKKELARPFLSTAYAKIDVFKKKITLRVGKEKIIFKSVKPASSLIKRVYMLSLRERMELDLEAKLIGETLVLNRSLDPFFGDFIELNDLNVPLELKRD